jgi:hypothetical protein
LGLPKRQQVAGSLRCEQFGSQSTLYEFFSFCLSSLCYYLIFRRSPPAAFRLAANALRSIFTGTVCAGGVGFLAVVGTFDVVNFGFAFFFRNARTTPAEFLDIHTSAVRDRASGGTSDSASNRFDAIQEPFISRHGFAIDVVGKTFLPL